MLYFFSWKKNLFFSLVIDELQEEFASYYEDFELKQSKVCQGTKEYQQNVEYLNTSIAELKKNPVKVTKEKQKISDGIKECWYGGSTNNKGMPTGEGMLVYENKDNFKGKFKVSFWKYCIY